MSFRQTKLLALALCGTALAMPASAALTIHSAPFIGTPTWSTGFESLGDITGADGVNSYSEDGISVNYVGDGFIWSTSQPTPDGLYSWYPDAGGTGYTSFTFDDATEFELLVGSGWFDGSGMLAYDVLLDGVSIGTGIAGGVPAYGNGWTTYGFSGATFDEVRLQVASGATGFDPAVYEAGAYDAVKIVAGAGPVVPEPATWALMIAGFACVGGLLRRTASQRHAHMA